MHNRREIFRIQWYFREPFKKIECDEAIYYVCSFSTRKDCLNQWKGYAQKDDSLSIVFENNNLDFVDDGHFNIQTAFYPRQTIYSSDTKEEILRKILDSYFQEYLVDIKNGEKSELGWVSHLWPALQHELINFKSSAFAAEAEVRLTLTNSQIQRYKLNHRVSNGRIIPFIATSNLYEGDLIDQKIPIKEIIVGPVANQEATIKSIKVFMENSGYKNVLINKSAIPYRG